MQAARRVADIAQLLGETADAAYYANVSATILTTLREKLYDKASGTFPDGEAAKIAAAPRAKAGFLVLQRCPSSP